MTSGAVSTGRAVATAAEFDAAGGWLPVSVLGDPWLLVRLDGQLAAVRDECPHRRVPLSAGERLDTPEGQRISCGYHGWQFAGTGECSRIPALGEGASVPRGMRVRAAEVVLRDGLLWISL